MPPLKKDTKIYLAGHRGLVGSAIFQRLADLGFENVVVRSRQELDLEDQSATSSFLNQEKPEVVVVAAALVGGIMANSVRPAEFIAKNLAIQQNLIWGSHLAGVGTLLFLGSSCVYPRVTPQPIPESALMTGPLESTNGPYAVAKIAGLTLCDSIRRQFGKNYFTVMPPNIYGDRDNYDPESSHVMAAMIRRFHESLPDKPVTCWGTGSPRREFLHSSEAAHACVFLLGLPETPSLVNIGTGQSVSIKELADLVQRVVGHRGEIVWDTSKPDGFPEKTNDVSLLRSLGWESKLDLERGVRMAYDWFRANLA